MVSAYVATAHYQVKLRQPLLKNALPRIVILFEAKQTVQGYETNLDYQLIGSI